MTARTTAEVFPTAALEPVGPGMSSRAISGSAEGAWTEPVFMEWELAEAQWTDRHPHAEYNYVLEGVLHVECGGTTVVARVGDLVHVPANRRARYFAPRRARMLAVYGANPDGAGSTVVGLAAL